MAIDFELEREQSLALVALSLVIVVCGAGAATSLGAWRDAAETITRNRDALAQVEATGRRGAAGRASAGLAPDAAFLLAPTPGQASALLQAHVTKLVAARGVSLGSSATLPSLRDDASEVVRMRMTFDMRLSALQALLLELETGAPYVFVDSLALAPQGGAKRGVETALHVTLELRALWRRMRI